MNNTVQQKKVRLVATPDGSEAYSVLCWKCLQTTPITNEFKVLRDILMPYFKLKGLKYRHSKDFNKTVQEAMGSIQQYALCLNEMADKCRSEGASLEEQLLNLLFNFSHVLLHGVHH